MEKWIAAGLVMVSLLLPFGWQWLKQKPTSAKSLKQNWLGPTAEFFYFVGLPYLTLVFGLLTPRMLGLKGLDYFSLISTASLLSDLQRVFTLVLVEWLVDIGPMMAMGLVAVIIFGVIIYVLAHYGVNEATSSETFLDTIYFTVHWAFYWALFWFVVDDLYLGVVMGSGWVILEWFFVARMQQARLGWQPQQLVTIMILLLTATIYFYYPNLWLLWLIHLAMVFLTRLICLTAIKSKRVESSL
jgi:hypothetical protein